jgi:hypothetical protein
LIRAAPHLSTVEAMTTQVLEYDHCNVEMGTNCYPDLSLLTQVHGVSDSCPRHLGMATLT